MPGRFNILRDFHMIVTPDRSNTFKSLYIKQKSLQNYGRIFFGSSLSDTASNPPAENNVKL